jgi:phosphoglycerate-specific signal transduction histidine kinase
MGNEDNEGRESDVRERIVSLIEATGQAQEKQITTEELQALKTAMSRLDQMLKTAADADVQALRGAAARLDQLLQNIGDGKDATAGLKRRRDWQSSAE